MHVKVLAEDKFQIVAIVDGEECPAEQFIQGGDPSTKSMRVGLVQMLTHVATRGLDDLPAGWVHEADKSRKVYEFIKGSLRLFFFKGNGNQIAVCACGGLKQGKKADHKAVDRAAKWRKQYFELIENGTLETVNED